MFRANSGVMHSGITGMFVFVVSFFITSLLQAMEPRDNYPAPPGFYFIDYPIYVTADSIKDKNGNTALDNVGLDLTLNVFRFAWYDKSLFDNSSCITLCMPYGRTELLGSHDAGFGDFELSFWHHFIDDSVNNLYLVAGSYIMIPFGDYDVENPASMGANVWQLRPAIGIAKTINQFTIEASLKYNIYEKNGDTDTKAGDELRFESNVGYMFNERFTTYIHFNGIWGDDQEIGGETIDDSGITKYQVGPAMTLMPSGKVPYMPVIALQYLADLGVENSAETQTFLGRLVWRF